MSVDVTVAAVRAESAKLRSIRSTLIPLALCLPVGLGIGFLNGRSARAAIDADSPLLRSDFTPEQAGLDGAWYVQLALIVFGVLAVSSEYGSNMIRLSLLAVPARGRLHAAKTTAVAMAAAVVAVPTTVGTYLVTQLGLGPHGASILTPGVPSALVGAVGYLVLMTLLAAGVAALARGAIVPLALLLPLVLVGSQLMSIVGATKAIARYCPDQAGMEMLTVGSDRVGFGLLVLLAWTVAAQVGGYLRLRGRDV